MGAYVIDLVERNELGVGDLVRRPPCLVDGVEVPGPNPDQAPDPPRPKVLGDRAFGHHRVRRRRNRRRVVVEVAGAAARPDPTPANASSACTKGSRLPWFRDASRLSVTTRKSGPSRSMAYGCWPPMTSDNTRSGGEFPDPEAEPASIRSANEVGPLDAELIQDRHRIGEAKRQRVCLLVMRLVAPSDAAVVDVDEGTRATPVAPGRCGSLEAGDGINDLCRGRRLGSRRRRRPRSTREFHPARSSRKA